MEIRLNQMLLKRGGDIRLLQCWGAASTVLIAFLILGGCVGIDDLSRENYRKGVLYTSNLSKETIAVLPMVAKGENRHYLHAAESIFYRALTEMRDQTNLISPEEGLAKIKEGNLDDFFQLV